MNNSLISIRQLCDAGCNVVFDATSTVTVRYSQQIVLTGQRTSNAAVGSATPAQIVAFAHAALFSPALSTLISAIKKGFLINFPGLPERPVRKHPPSASTDEYSDSEAKFGISIASLGGDQAGLV
jgi:hypothetical protein